MMESILAFIKRSTPDGGSDIGPGWILQMRIIATALHIEEIPWQKIIALLHPQLTGDN
jgi:hypothetical protein